jgi:HK97 family phage major capsid protein
MEPYMHVQKLADIAKQRGVAFDEFNALANKEVLTPEETKSFDELRGQIQNYDTQATRVKEAQAIMAKSAQPVAGQSAGGLLPAQAKSEDAYTKKDGLVVGGIVRMLAATKGNIREAGAFADSVYGGSHPVTKAFAEGSGPGGGFLVAPDYMNEIIELLRAETVVRSAGPRMIPMPRGTMTLPGQASASTATYGSETAAIQTSQPGTNEIIASAKKLTALVPITNDLLRDTQFTTAADALVRDDLVQVISLREDLAFLVGDGTNGTPRGYLSFAQAFQKNLISSTFTFTLPTVAAELGAARTRLKKANVKLRKPCWFMGADAEGYLFNVQNSLGLYVYREEMIAGTLLNIPFKMSQQIPENVTFNTNPNTSYVFLAEMTDTMILDTMQMELMVSQEGTYLNAAGQTVSAVQNDQTLIRAIARHDFQMRHDASVAVIQGVNWAPAIS